MDTDKTVEAAKVCECGIPLTTKKGIRYRDATPAQLQAHFAHQDRAAARRSRQKRDAMTAEKDAEIERLTEKLAAAEKDNQRLRDGAFTEGEFQNLCHGLSTDDAERFCDGCEAYHIKLFGYSPITKLREANK